MLELTLPTPGLAVGWQLIKEHTWNHSE